MLIMIAKAFGDSWVDYPIPFVGGGLYDHLSKLTNIPIYNDGHAGDSSEETMGLKKRLRLEPALKECNVIFWSSGGDDFAGDQFVVLLNKNIDGDVTKAINWTIANEYFNLIIADYKCLFELRDNINPNCWIVYHCYDFPPPSVMGKGILMIGPWLQPGLTKQGWTKIEDQAAIVKLMLQELQKRYYQFSLTQKNCLFVDTQGILAPDDWANELHLTDIGWTKLAMIIKSKLSHVGLI